MRHAFRLILAPALFMSLPACFGDTPSEPSHSADLSSTSFNIIDLGDLGGVSSAAYDINTLGQIVGRAQRNGGEYHAFHWQQGVMTDMGTLVGNAEIPSAAVGINDAGLIVGWSSKGGQGDEHAFLWQSGSMHDLGGTASEESHGTAINLSGLTVGDNLDSYSRPVIWEKNGLMSDLGALDRGAGAATDINDRGQVVGWSEVGFRLPELHGFLWENGNMKDIGLIFPMAINNSAQVVGGTGFWANGKINSLGTLGGSAGSAQDINDAGQVVGYSTTSTGQTHAFVWYNGRMTDLGTLGGDLSRAYAINASGQIVGESNASVGGPAHAVRWTLPPLVPAWSSRNALPSARNLHAIGVANGLLFSIGGLNSSGGALRAVQAFNPATNAWSTKASLPGARHTGNGATTIGSSIYVAGGKDAAGAITRTLYAYNWQTNVWSSRTSMPVVGGCGGSAVILGKLYVFSGCTHSSTGDVPAGLLHRYDPATNQWTTLRPAPEVHVQPVVGAISGKLYVAGGNGAFRVPTGRLDIYDPATNTWSQGAPMTPRVAAYGAVVGSKLYVVGGRNLWESASTPTYLRTVEVFDPRTHRWGIRAAMPTARAGLGIGAVNQLIYAVGGRSSSSVLSVNERYTP